MRTRVGVLALLALLSVACGKIQGGSSADAAPGADAMPMVDAAPPGPCDPGGDPTFEEGLECISVGFCQMFARCFQPFEAEQCEHSPFSPLGGDGFDRHVIAEAIEAGRVTYDPAGVRQCIEFFAEISCAELNEVPGELLDFCPFLAGTVADGDDCLVDFECATPHALCTEPTKCVPGDPCCVRGCVAPVRIEQPCVEGEIPCEPGHYCVNTPEGSFCYSGDADQPCDFDSDCEVALYCDPATSTCKPEVEAGTSCTEDEQCPGAETCLGNDLSGGEGSGTCGRSDRADDMCDGDCFGLHCDQPDSATLGTCVPYVQEEGGDCSVIPCAAPGWACDRAADQCTRRPTIGETCNNSDLGECEFGLFCTNDISGEPEGVCATRLADGELCSSDFQCDSGLCSGEPLVCQPYPGCF